MSSEPDDDETYQDLAAQAGAQVEAVAQMEAQAQAPAPVQAQAQAQTQTQASSQSQVGAQAEVQLAELLSTPGYFGNDWWNCPAATQREADFARHAVELSTAAGVRLQRIFSPPSMPTPEAVLQYTEYFLLGDNQHIDVEEHAIERIWGPLRRLAARVEQQPYAAPCSTGKSQDKRVPPGPRGTPLPYPGLLDLCPRPESALDREVTRHRPPLSRWVVGHHDDALGSGACLPQARGHQPERRAHRRVTRVQPQAHARRRLRLRLRVPALASHEL